MDKEIIKEILKKNKPYLKKRYGITSIGLFGSFVKGKQKKSSDIDILVEFNKPNSLFDLLDVEFYLEDILKRDVDLVPKDSLRKHIGNYILQEVQYI